MLSARASGRVRIGRLGELPEMDGEAVAREIRRTHPHVPILMLSGQIDVPKHASSAVDAFVAKGQPPAVLLGHLTLLSQAERRKERNSAS